MYLKTLFLKQFRNYSDASLEFKPGLTVICGPNASGKSTILEAIHLLAKAKSSRTAVIREAVQWGSDAFFLKGSFETPLGRKQIAFRCSNGERKSVSVNGKEVQRLYELAGQVPIVLFVPDDLLLVKADPEYRRQYLNSILGQINREYLVQSISFQKIVSERNQALRQIRDQRMGVDELLPWNEGLIAAGTCIIQARKRIVDELNTVLAGLPGIGGAALERISLSYQTIFKEWPGDENVRAQYERLVAEKQGIEMELGQTLIGPHRDDVEISQAGRPLRSFGSQGQQRKAVLSMKLASVLLLEGYFAAWPITLFDDVLSELDEDSQEAFEEMLLAMSRKSGSGGALEWQCFVTTAERYGRWEKKDISVLRVERGKVSA